MVNDAEDCERMTTRVPDSWILSVSSSVPASQGFAICGCADTPLARWKRSSFIELARRSDLCWD